MCLHSLAHNKYFFDTNLKPSDGRNKDSQTRVSHRCSVQLAKLASCAMRSEDMRTEKSLHVWLRHNTQLHGNFFSRRRFTHKYTRQILKVVNFFLCAPPFVKSSEEMRTSFDRGTPKSQRFATAEARLRYLPRG